MFALVCLSILSCAFAAPQFYQFQYPPPPPPPPHHHHDSGLNQFFGDGVFDTKKFWSDFSKEMNQFEHMMDEFMREFPKQESTSGIQGNEYKINIVLHGLEEKDITVKAREGLVMVQAIHKNEDGGERSYLDIRTLPTSVRAESGVWTYEESVLGIVFPLKKDITTEAPEVQTSETPSTQEPDREEMESHENDDNLDADVGIRGDNDVKTNEIPQGTTEEAVEATTYAVDFNDEVEFVPVQMQRQKAH